MNKINTAMSSGIYPISLEELVTLNNSEIINKKSLVYFALQLEDLNNFDINQFCKKWNISKASFNKAIAELQKLKVIAIESGKIYINKLTIEEV